MEEFKKKAYPLLEYEKAKKEGRLVIQKTTGREHRSFPCTLLVPQVAKTFKLCLNKGEFDNFNQAELMTIAKKLLDCLIKQDNKNIDTVYTYLRPRLEKYYSRKRI